MKRLKILVWGAVIGVYAVWVYTGPLETLAIRYGDSGMTWGVLVFGLMIPYSVYFIFNIFQSRKKGNAEDVETKE
jgi:hypothetical protein